MEPGSIIRAQASPAPIQAFAQEVARLRQANVLGAAGRLRDLFDFLADRGLDAEPANQSEISAAVFGQADPEADDATVRVYVHRLRKRLGDHYAVAGASSRVRLEIPAGTYALRLATADPPAEPVPTLLAHQPPDEIESARRRRAFLPLAAAVLAILAFAAGWVLAPATRSATNPIWEPLLASDRPVLMVMGDYYIYGEIDPLRPEEGRLIRDFRVNSASDLQSMQELLPERYSGAQDMGLNYLPFSSAYALDAVEPMLRARGKQVTIIAASDLEADMLNHYDIIYIGLLSGMHLLEDLNFMGSGFAVGESYDELIDIGTRRSYVSQEALSLASKAYYRDYAYLARYRAPSGALVIALGGVRDTGLRGLGPIVAGPRLTTGLAEVARDDDQFEALFEITGQQGADLSDRLVLARARAKGQP